MKLPDIKDPRFENVQARLDKMKTRASEFCQTRSNFQIEKFIACDEYTPISRFRHVAHNSYITMQEIRREIIQRERLTRKIEKLQECVEYQITLEEYDPSVEYLQLPDFDPHFMDYDLDIFELTRQLDDIDIRIKGLMREVEYMEAICDALEAEEIEKTGCGFTDKKYQEQEPMYWEKRLANQMHTAQIGAQTGVGEGNYKSALLASETPLLDNSINQINKIPMEVNELAVKALEPVPGVKEKYLISEESVITT